MLDRRTDILRLNAVDDICGSASRKKRVFRKVFKVAPAQGIPMNIESRSKENVDFECGSLIA